MATPEERARHLDRAASYLDDAVVTAEAREALVGAGTALLQASRHLDALRLLERALALGPIPAAALLDLARLQALSSRDVDALRTLSLIEDDPARSGGGRRARPRGRVVDDVPPIPTPPFPGWPRRPSAGGNWETRPRKPGPGATPAWPTST